MISLCKTSLLVCVLLPFCLVAQKENANWYFGAFAAVSFQNGTVKSLDSCAMNAFEGCATISDTAGRLLFYTDGIKVFNKRHVMMLNGSGLQGNPSSSQSAMIVRKPGDYNIYYIITVNGVSGQPNLGAFCNIIDMSKDGGNGEIVKKNILLQATTDEKITALIHRNGRDIWIVIPERNTAYINSYLLTDTGINFTPVVSNTYLTTIGSIGYVRVSNNCRRLAMAIYYPGRPQLVVVADYDNNTGIVSNPYQLPHKKPYGLEFSPNGRYLYVSSERTDSNLCQYDLEAGTYYDVQQSRYELLNMSNFVVGGLQLGIDNMIYFSEGNQNFLGRIKFPDLPQGDCGAVTNAIVLKKGRAQYGLQNCMVSLPGKPDIMYTFKKTSCNIRTQLSLTNYVSVKSVSWNFGDSLSILKYNISDSLAPMHNYTFGTYYKVSAVLVYNNLKKDTLFKWILLPSFSKVALTPCFPDSISKCPNESILLQCSLKSYSFLWENGDTSSKRNITKIGIYKLKYIDKNLCTDSQIIKVNEFKVRTDIGPDKTICKGDSVFIEELSNFNIKSYQWSNGSKDSFIFAKADQTYILKTRDNNNCSVSDTIQIIGKVLPQAELGLDTAICQGDSVVILAKNPDKNDRYTWNGDSVPAAKAIYTTGRLSLIAERNACVSFDTVNISVIDYPITELGPDDSVCMNGFYSLDAGLASKYVWNTGSREKTINIVQSGTYSVKTGNGQCYSYDSIHIALKDIRLFIPNAFTPNDDAVNDVFALDPEINFIEFQVYNTWGEMIYESHDEHPAWNGQYKSAFCQTGYYLLKVVYWDCQHRRVYKSQGFYLLL